MLLSRNGIGAYLYREDMTRTVLPPMNGAYVGRMSQTRIDGTRVTGSCSGCV